MKFLLVFFVVLVFVWRWRTARTDDVALHQQRPTPPADSQTPVPMVSCRQCGVHLAQTDAVPGSKGVYCGREHLALAES